MGAVSRVRRIRREVMVSSLPGLVLDGLVECGQGFGVAGAGPDVAGDELDARQVAGSGRHCRGGGVGVIGGAPQDHVRPQQAQAAPGCP